MPLSNDDKLPIQKVAVNILTVNMAAAQELLGTDDMAKTLTHLIELGAAQLAQEEGLEWQVYPDPYAATRKIPPHLHDQIIERKEDRQSMSFILQWLEDEHKVIVKQDIIYKIWRNHRRAQAQAASA